MYDNVLDTQLEKVFNSIGNNIGKDNTIIIRRVIFNCIKQHNKFYNTQCTIEGFLRETKNPKILDWFLDDDDSHLREQIAVNANASKRILNTLSRDVIDHVRFAVALNPSTSPSILKRLSQQRESEYTKSIAKFYVLNIKTIVRKEFPKDPRYKLVYSFDPSSMVILSSNSKEHWYFDIKDLDESENFLRNKDWLLVKQGDRYYYCAVNIKASTNFAKLSISKILCLDKNTNGAFTINLVLSEDVELHQICSSLESNLRLRLFKLRLERRPLVNDIKSANPRAPLWPPITITP